jgi:hypothetical protein
MQGLNFHSIDTFSTSFLNSSIGAIIEDNGFVFFKSKVAISHYTTLMGNHLKKYINDFKNLEIPR